MDFPRLIDMSNLPWSPWKHYPPFLTAFVLGLALLTPGCGDGLTVRLEFRVSLGVSPDRAVSGAMLTFTISNDGDGTVGAEGDRFEFIVRDSSGDEVRRLAAASGGGTLAPGESLSEIWDQRDATGTLVSPGDYTVAVRYRAGDDLRARTEGFTIG